MNILFFFILFGYRVYFYSLIVLFNLNEDETKKFDSTTAYINMDDNFRFMNTVVFLLNANFLIFIFTYVNNLKIFSYEFDIIQRNLAEVKLKYFIVFNKIVFLENLLV